MDSSLEYMLSGACGLLQLRPIVPGASSHGFSRPRGWQCLSAATSPQSCLTVGSGLAPGRGGWQDGRIGGQILPARAYCRVEK
jgi:hypothetical protein